MIGPRSLKPVVLIGSVIQDQVHDQTHTTGVQGLQQRLEVLQAAVYAGDLVEVGDVVAIILKRRRIDRHQPDAVNSQVFQIVEPSLQAFQITVTVSIAVSEGAQIDLIKGGVLVPERFCHRVLLQGGPYASVGEHAKTI